MGKLALLPLNDWQEQWKMGFWYSERDLTPAVKDEPEMYWPDS